MNRLDVWARCWEAALQTCENLGGTSHELRIGRPATQLEVEKVEREIGTSLPSSYRRAVLELSASVQVRWSLP